MPLFVLRRLLSFVLTLLATSVVVFVVMGISAFATLKGITAVLRVATVDTVALDMPAGASLSVLGVPGLGYWLGTALVLIAWRHKDFWTLDNFLASLGVGTHVMADHDASGAGEHAAAATGLPYAMPADEGMDANDVHGRDGLEAVVELVMRRL